MGIPRIEIDKLIRSHGGFSAVFVGVDGVAFDNEIDLVGTGMMMGPLSFFRTISTY